MADPTGMAAVRREERRARHHDLSRSQLLDAAEEVFGRQGFHESTIKQVAARAGFAVGSVYSFFGGKDDLFRELFRRRGAQFVAGMAGVLSAADAPPAQLRALVTFEVAFFREHHDFARLFLRYSGTSQLALGLESDPEIAARYAESMGLQCAVIRRGQAAGDFRAGDPEVLAALVSGLVAAYQAADPAVLGDASSSARLPLDDLCDVVGRAVGAVG